MLRRRRAPESVRSAVGSGDRLVGWALTTEQAPVVATVRGLTLPGHDLVLWQDVEKAVWARPLLRITVLPPGATVVAGTGPSYEVVLEDGGDLPEVIRTRVTGSVAWTSHSRLRPAGGVRVVGRRNPDREVFDWQLIFDQGTDLEDASVRAQAEQLLEAARRAIG